MAVLVARPGSPVALLQVTAVAVALAIGAGLAGSPRHLLPALGVVLTAALLSWLGGVQPPAPPSHPVRVSAVLIAAAVVPAAAYAWDMARSTADPEETVGLDHYPVQAAFAIAVVLVAGLAAYAASAADPMRWLPGLTAAFSAVWIGALSVVWPHRLGSLGTGWGCAAVVWGAALLVAVGVEGRERSRTGRDED